jgi:hypothetical protein
VCLAGLSCPTRGSIRPGKWLSENRKPAWLFEVRWYYMVLVESDVVAPVRASVDA